jgi:hypothetical protein
MTSGVGQALITLQASGSFGDGFTTGVLHLPYARHGSHGSYHKCICIYSYFRTLSPSLTGSRWRKFETRALNAAARVWSLALPCLPYLSLY